jgi:hypothetical protein
MTKTLSICGVTLAVWAVAATSATAPASQSAGNSRIVVAEYMRAVPAGPAGAHACKKVCIKSGGGTATHPPHCLHWQTVC